MTPAEWFALSKVEIAGLDVGELRNLVDETMTRVEKMEAELRPGSRLPPNDLYDAVDSMHDPSILGGWAKLHKDRKTK